MIWVGRPRPVFRPLSSALPTSASRRLCARSDRPFLPRFPLPCPALPSRSLLPGARIRWSLRIFRVVRGPKAVAGSRFLVLFPLRSPAPSAVDCGSLASGDAHPTRSSAPAAYRLRPVVNISAGSCLFASTSGRREASSYGITTSSQRHRDSPKAVAGSQ